MRLVLTYKNKVLLQTPVNSEREFCKLLNQLERDIQGVAICSLFDNSVILIQRSLNNPPKRVYNSFNDTWYDFEYFKKHSSIFPLRTCMLYENYCNDKELIKNGFFTMCS